MRFIVCPYCKVHIKESDFPPSRQRRDRIVMACPSCKNRLAFTIRRPEADPPPEVVASFGSEASLEETTGRLEVVENRFAYGSEFVLRMGENRIGRYNDKYTALEVAIRTTDPSMDRFHCTLIAEKTTSGGFNFFLIDNNSLTGTFVNTREIEQGEKCLLQSGDVITLGATSILFSIKKPN